MQAFFSSVTENYEAIRGVEKDEAEVRAFWDVVVLTAVDDEQKRVYEEQLEYKRTRRELPLGVPIYVVSDPPGRKIGNGGSTLTCVQYLHEEFGSKLFTLRVLLIHAGGQSQRMPSASVLGKIFSPIPRGQEALFEMLDIKLAMYGPLIPKMGPGIFVACADDFLVYNLGDEHEGITFAAKGFTALAHPSPIEVGVGHGVYVLEDPDSVNRKAHLQSCKCKQVLQKPSEAVMFNKGAVLKKENAEFADGITVKGRVAYTDSSFFFAHDVTKLFLGYMKKKGKITCEIDAYGDFLQALGPDATVDYTQNVSNVSTVSPELGPTRVEVFELLRGTDITVLVMNSSKFIHIGTTKEYIEHYCCDSEFQSEMGLGKDIFNLWPHDRGTQLPGSGDADTQKCSLLSDTSLGCVMHSIIPFDSCIASTAVLEYCNFNIPIRVGQNCILSNCEYIATKGKSKARRCAKSLDIPNNLFLHTIPVLMEETTKYVTVFFDIKDNLKKAAPANNVKQLAFLGKLVEDYMNVLDLNLASILVTPMPKANLWFTKLFPVSDTMTQSLATALQCITALKTDDSSMGLTGEKNLVSMATLLKIKDLDALLKQRNDLYNEIKMGRKTASAN